MCYSHNMLQQRIDNSLALTSNPLTFNANTKIHNHCVSVGDINQYVCAYDGKKVLGGKIVFWPNLANWCCWQEIPFVLWKNTLKDSGKSYSHHCWVTRSSALSSQTPSKQFLLQLLSINSILNSISTSLWKYHFAKHCHNILTIKEKCSLSFFPHSSIKLIYYVRVNFQPLPYATMCKYWGGKYVAKIAFIKWYKRLKNQFLCCPRRFATKNFNRYNNFNTTTILLWQERWKNKRRQKK